MATNNKLTQSNFNQSQQQPYNNNLSSIENQEIQKNVSNKFNHGSYLITTNGWTFIHSQPPKRSNFILIKGDILTLKFDPILSLLIAVKNDEFNNATNIPF